MARQSIKKAVKKISVKRAAPDPFKVSRKHKEEPDPNVHILKPGIVCDTEPRGFATPKGQSIARILVDASEGFIPLWTKNTTLRWRFRERSLAHFENPTAAKSEIRDLIGDTLMAWGAAAPVRFKEDNDVWDFEVVTRSSDDCDNNGCVLASAFFPDAGRHKLYLYPQMFLQTRKEQVETLVHEFGHIFGLRHFFAKLQEKSWPSEIFGKHSKFSIMNYGRLSKLTAADKNDLTKLYQQVWSGALTKINGTPIKLVKPFHTLS